MKKAYPIVITPAEEGGYVAYIPDIKVTTQGDNMAEVMFMARDAIGMMGCYEEDEHRKIPEPSPIESIQAESDKITTLVDVDFEAYRKKLDNRTVRKNVTIPSWLNVKAEKAGINFSATLQGALKKQLKI